MHRVLSTSFTCLQATPDPNPLHMPAMLLAEVEVQMKEEEEEDVHLELLWAQQLLPSDFPGSYSVAAIAITECREWRSPHFIVRNE